VIIAVRAFMIRIKGVEVLVENQIILNPHQSYGVFENAKYGERYVQGDPYSR
jgi:hypothetical protein